MKLIVDWQIFKKEISDLISQGDALKLQFDSNKKFEDQKAQIDSWHGELLNAFETSFDVSDNEFSSEIRTAFKDTSNTFRPPVNSYNQPVHFPKSIEQENREKNVALHKNLEGLIRVTKFYLKFLSASDAVIYPQKIEINDRSTYTTEDILVLILEKLYILYDTNYISINSILQFNGIKLARHGEDRELAKILENRGLVNVQSTRDVSAQLTLEGKIFVEQLQKPKKSNYEKINENQEEFERTVDEILSRLEKLGFGQQIIFDELEELKDLHLKLSKKNFGQILKGKLIDLTLSKTIENDTLEYIYKTITDESLKLS